MDKKKVSVIIPAYNSAGYIGRCLDSLLKQSHNNLEIIVVDDGSQDNTRQEVENYAADNGVIKYVYQENTGAAGARNNGLGLATGDYITFCDSDDTVIPSFIETLVSECEKGADMAVAGYMNITEDGEILAKRSISEKPLGIYANVATCGKLYKAEFVKKADLRFLKGATLFEDSYFTLKAYNSADKIGVSQMIGYQIYENPASVTRTTGKSMAVIDSVIETFSKIKSDITPKDKEIFDYFLIKSAIYTVLFSCKGAEKKELFSQFDKLFAWVKSNTEAKNKYINPFMDNGEIFPVRLVVWGFSMLRKLGLAKLAVLLYSRL